MSADNQEVLYQRPGGIVSSGRIVGMSKDHAAIRAEKSTRNTIQPAELRTQYPYKNRYIRIQNIHFDPAGTMSIPVHFGPISWL